MLLSANELHASIHSYLESLPDGKTSIEEAKFVLDLLCGFPKLDEVVVAISALRADGDNTDAAEQHPLSVGIEDEDTVSISELDQDDIQEISARQWLVNPHFDDEIAALHQTYNDKSKALDDLVERIRTNFKLTKIPSLVYDRKKRTVNLKVPLKQASRLCEDPRYVSDLGLRNKSFVYIFNQDVNNKHNSQAEASEAIRKKEGQLLNACYDKVATHLLDLENLGKLLAEVDVSMGLAELAAEQNYVRPSFVSGNVLHITDGRHPVIEAALLRQNRPFVSNTLSLDQSSGQFVLITGPNMGGKSTLLRQTAIIVLLAQAGSYVPARSATLSLVDGIYTRIGAQDDLFRNKSTFMQEMSEASSILDRATSNSLVLLDELGRGTSIIDGLALSYAISLYLLNRNRSKVLFATHLHELGLYLGQNSQGKPIIFMCTDALQSSDGQYAFSYSLRPGINRDSRGLLTAEMAGMPQEVLDIAREASRMLLANRGDA